MNKTAVISNFIAFFCFIKKVFPPGSSGGKMNADPDPQPWFKHTNEEKNKFPSVYHDSVNLTLFSKIIPVAPIMDEL